MKLKTFTKNWKLWLLVVFLVLSLITIRPQFGVKGAVVSYISPNSPVADVLQKGDLIETINGQQIKDSSDVTRFYGKEVTVNGIKVSNFTGIDVKNPSKTNLNLGLELVGGSRVILQPEERINHQTAQEIMTTLETRVNSFGLKDFKFQSIKGPDNSYFIQVEIAGGSQEEVRELLEKQGKLQGIVPIEVSLQNNQGTLELDSNHPFTVTENTLTINEKTISVNQTNSTVTIEGIKFNYGGTVNSKAILNAIVFGGGDIEISQDTTRTFVQGNQFNIGIIVSKDSAERFAKITEHIPSSQGYLTSQLTFYLDENKISSFNIGSELKGKVIRDPSISGSRETEEAAVEEMMFIKSVLKSGALPVKLSIVKSDTISPSLGSEFIKSTFIAGTFALLAVFAVLYFTRYRDLRVSLLMMGINVSEVIITLGVAAMLGATIDLLAIAGIIAVVGTGVNQLIIITDESRTKENISLKMKIKRGLFVIFASAATTVSAMIPLMIIGLGAVKSFALLTIVGVLTGVLITRPAYAQLYTQLIKE